MYLVISLAVMALVVGAIVFFVKKNAKSGPATVGGQPPKNPPTPLP